MYNVQILSDQEFESLPYPETETSWGIADPTTRTAYVRYDKSPEVLNYLVNHEVEHLIEGHGGTHSDHYRNGVYYKGAGGLLGIIAPLLSFIPGIGPLLSAGAGLGGGLLGQREQQKGMSQQNQMGGGGYAQPQGPPVTTFPSQQARGGAQITSNAPSSEGASGSTGALGNLMGSPVDKLRSTMGTGYEEEMLRRSKGSGLGGF